MEVLLFQEVKRAKWIKRIVDFLCSRNKNVSSRRKLHTQLSSLMMYEKLFSNDVFFPEKVSQDGIVSFSKTIPDLKPEELESFFKKAIDRVKTFKKQIQVRMKKIDEEFQFYIGKQPLLPIHFKIYYKLCKDLKRNNIPKDDWNNYIALLLCRYFTSLGGESNQLGISYYQSLQKFEPIKVELFASPINHTIDKFCSLYPDTDSVFGSLGSVFDFIKSPQFTEGFYVANPPYHSKTMTMFIQTLLERMKEVRCSVLITCPVWDYDGFCKLGIPELCYYKTRYEMFELAKESDFYRFHVLHTRDKHTYLNHRKQNQVEVVGTYSIFLSSKNCAYENELQVFLEYL